MRSRLAIALTLMAAALAFGAGGAQGAVVSGSNLADPPNSYVCVGQQQGCTLSIQDLPAATRAAGGARAAIDGVIVSWSMRSGNAQAFPIRLHLTREGKGVGAGPTESMPIVAGIHSFSARMPVKAGDQIGVDFEPPKFIEVQVTRFDSVGAAMDHWQPVLGPTEERAPFADGKANYELLVNATIEPDADRDGWGDETQDKCPGRADPSNACPPVVGGGPTVPDDHAPTTAIDKVRIQGGRATFRFSSPELFAKFRCKLDKQAWQKCKSPKVYKGLKAGRHSFKVKAIGTNGKPDRTPAKRSFRVSL